MRKNNFIGTLANGQQFVLHIVGKDILSFYDSVDFIFFAQLVEHGFGDTALCCNFSFYDTAVFRSNGGKFGYIIHALTSF